MRVCVQCSPRFTTGYCLEIRKTFPLPIAPSAAPTAHCPYCPTAHYPLHSIRRMPQLYARHTGRARLPSIGRTRHRLRHAAATAMPASLHRQGHAACIGKGATAMTDASMTWAGGGNRRGSISVHWAGGNRNDGSIHFHGHDGNYSYNDCRTHAAHPASPGTL